MYLNAWERRAVWLTAWICLLVVVTSCGAASNGLQGRAVPWIGTPGTDLRYASSSSAQRPCRSHDIVISVGSTGAYQGYATQELTLRNKAIDACFVPAPPPLDVVLGNGQHRSVASDSRLTMVGASIGQAGLASGQAVQLLVGTPGTCATVGNPNIANVMTLTLLTNEVVTISGVNMDVECGSPSLLIFSVAQVPEAAVPESALRATLSIPSTATPGQTFVYFVTLYNSSVDTIALAPCPSYTQSFGITNVVRQTLLLNCAASGPIASGASVMFEMELQVPPSMVKGVTKLSWQLDVPNGAFVGSAVTVN